MSIQTTSMRRLRLGAGVTRWAFYGVALVGVIATTRLTLFPPGAVRPPAVVSRGPDRSAEEYAVLFARQYLTWDAGRPEARTVALAPFAGPGLDAGAGFRAPAAGSQAVRWAEVAQERQGAQGDRVYTVAAETDRAGLVYLAVDVGRTPDGRVRLMGYPALVGAPLSAPADAGAEQHLADVVEKQLSAVVERALRNYLAGSAANLAADLTTDAHVSSPGRPLTMGDLVQLRWAAGEARASRAHTVLATVHASDADGSDYTLRYEIDVARVEARWEVAAIEMDPTA